MNERIKELKYQAEALAYEEHKTNCIKNGRDPSMSHANALNMTFEKFAELLIERCVKAVENTPLGYGDYRDQILESMRDSCVESIKHEFGCFKEN